MKTLMLFALLAVPTATETIASGSFVFPAATIAPRSCDTKITTPDARIVPLSKQEMDSGKFYKIVVSWRPTTPNGFYVMRWPEDHSVTFQDCNSTTSPLTIPALDVAWTVSK